jgi:hypothetical protein
MALSTTTTCATSRLCGLSCLTCCLAGSTCLQPPGRAGTARSGVCLPVRWNGAVYSPCGAPILRLDCCICVLCEFILHERSRALRGIRAAPGNKHDTISSQLPTPSLLLPTAARLSTSCSRTAAAHRCPSVRVPHVRLPRFSCCRQVPLLARPEPEVRRPGHADPRDQLRRRSCAAPPRRDRGVPARCGRLHPAPGPGPCVRPSECGERAPAHQGAAQLPGAWRCACV